MDLKRYLHALSLRDQGMNEEALRELQVLADAESSPEQKGSLILDEITCLWRLGRLAEARRRFTEGQAFWKDVRSKLFGVTLTVAEAREEGKPERLAEALMELQAFLAQHGHELKLESPESYGEALIGAGYLLIALDRYKEAIQPLAEAWPFFKSDERGSRLEHDLGICLMQTGDLEAAEKHLVNALPSDRTDPRWAEAQYLLGCLYFREGWYPQAKQAFELAEMYGNDKLRRHVPAWLERIEGILGRAEPN